MNILGIGGYSHDSAAALIVDGRVVAAVAEERLTRVKHQGGIPRTAAAWCLEQARFDPGDLDFVTGYMRPGIRLGRRLGYRLLRAPRHPAYSAAYAGYELVHNAQYMAGMRSLCGPNTRLHYMEHHPAHAASAFFCCPYDTAAILSIDYIGEWCATWAGLGRGTLVRHLGRRSWPHSLGTFYTAITDYLGFARASDEYKVMGLAAYGEPEYLDAFREMVRIRPDGWYRMDLAHAKWHYAPGSRVGYFSSRFIARFGPPRQPGEPITERHQNIAASAQAILEEAVLGLARWLYKTTGLKHLCLAGGVALNCAMNGRLLRETPFEELWVQPASGDDGIAIGGALQCYYAHSKSPRRPAMRTAYLGPRYTDEAIRAFLDEAKLPYTEPDDIAEAVAERLAAGDIVAWFQGAMEFGPRALGARSILADPTRAEMKDRLNALVKHREPFRPFAPSVLEEEAGVYFEGCGRAPYMLVVYPVRPEHRANLPAITHAEIGRAHV